MYVCVCEFWSNTPDDRKDLGEEPLRHVTPTNESSLTYEHDTKSHHTLCSVNTPDDQDRLGRTTPLFFLSSKLSGLFQVLFAKHTGWSRSPWRRAISDSRICGDKISPSKCRHNSLRACSIYIYVCVCIHICINVYSIYIYVHKCIYAFMHIYKNNYRRHFRFQILRWNITL